MRTIYVPADQSRLRTAVLSIVRTPALRHDVEVSRSDYRGAVTVTAPTYLSTGQEVLWQAAESMSGHGQVHLGELARAVDEESLRAVARAFLLLAGALEDEEAA